ncbi:MAG: hypothetical protein BWK76_16080 [Desulfobulbaceae bacterium A2]|nr:MAG: hypothetical protein BWK76_16080 [Desulfobulbaceae bacterium A2]
MADDVYLVDTTAWIYALRRDSIVRIRQRLEQLLQLNTVRITPYIRLELLANVRTEEEYQRLEKGLGAVIGAPVDETTWDLACRLGFSLRSKGVDLATPCVITAACAIRHQTVLLHADNGYDLAASHLQCSLESYAYLLPA